MTEEDIQEWQAVIVRQHNLERALDNRAMDIEDTLGTVEALRMKQRLESNELQDIKIRLRLLETRAR